MRIFLFNQAIQEENTMIRFVAVIAVNIGDVEMVPGGSIRFNCVARGDVNFICGSGYRPGSSAI